MSTSVSQGTYRAAGHSTIDSISTFHSEPSTSNHSEPYLFSTYLFPPYFQGTYRAADRIHSNNRNATYQYPSYKGVVGKTNTSVKRYRARRNNETTIHGPNSNDIRTQTRPSTLVAPITDVGKLGTARLHTVTTSTPLLKPSAPPHRGAGRGELVSPTLEGEAPVLPQYTTQHHGFPGFASPGKGREELASPTLGEF